MLKRFLRAILIFFDDDKNRIKILTNDPTILRNVPKQFKTKETSHNELDVDLDGKDPSELLEVVNENNAWCTQYEMYIKNGVKILKILIPCLILALFIIL